MARSVDNVDQPSAVVASEVKEAIVDYNKDPCTYCGQNPCDWVMFETEICEECKELVEQNRSDKEV
jgi:hypothetical protein